MNALTSPKLPGAGTAVPLAQLGHPDDLPVLQAEMQRSIVTPGSGRWTGRVCLESGTKWISILFKNHRLADGTIRWKAVHSDETDSHDD